MPANEFSQGAPHLIILGIRGVPAAHGGFETFAEKLALYLQARGWTVTVYCQGSASGLRETDTWFGVRRILIPTKIGGSLGTVEFDIKCALDVLREPGLVLTLGYNTGFLAPLLAAYGRTNCINMDGIEWKRAKYNRFSRAYLWLNERIAALAGTRLIADHPVIGDHLATRVARDKITVIPYGSNAIESANSELLSEYGLKINCFCTVIARAEPENSILQMVEGFSKKTRGIKLVVIGKYDRRHAYQKSVLDAASCEVIFPGSIYDPKLLEAFRFYSLAYLHGHQVGGTNPSLVEALGARNAVLAHDNPFNRWVAGDAATYFTDSESFSTQIEALITDPVLRMRLSNAARARWSSDFTWPHILREYELFLENVISKK